MIIIAFAGVIANGLALYKLKANEGLNSKVMGLHLLEDVLGWVSVLIGGIVIKFFNLHIIDPILSIAITLYILFNVFKNLRSAFQLFMQKSPATIDSNEILFKIKEDKNIISIEDFHIWSLEGTQHVLSAHIKVKDSIEPADMIALKSRIREEIKKYGDIHSTIEFEYESENCDDHC
jgi:cobalt-zinc-cadmium efflux system protein